MKDWIDAKPFEIVRVGKHPGSFGEVDVTKEMILSFIASFAQVLATGAEADRPGFRFGHPGLLGGEEVPRIGQINDLWIEGESLWCKASFRPSAKEELLSGSWPGRSIGFFGPDASGKYWLDHVAITGASRPACPGMEPIQFAAGSGAARLIEIFTRGEYSFGSNGSAALAVGADINSQPKETANMPKPNTARKSLWAKIGEKLGLTEIEVAELAAGDPVTEPPAAEGKKDTFEAVWSELDRISKALSDCMGRLEKCEGKMKEYDGEEGGDAADAPPPEMTSGDAGKAQEAALTAELSRLEGLNLLTAADAKLILQTVTALPLASRQELADRMIALSIGAPEMKRLASPLFHPKGTGRLAKFKEIAGRDPKSDKEVDDFMRHNPEVAAQV